MRAPARLALFGAALLAAGGAAYGVGTATGPVLPAAEEHSYDAGPPDDPGHASGAASHEDGAGHAGERPTGVTGLAVADDGLALRLERTTLAVGAQELRFRVEQADGSALLDYDATHERDLHLVVVRRDLTRFQHLHPVRSADGTWSVPLLLDAPGPYRVYADFAPAGRPARALATDVVVPGAYSPERDLPGERRTSSGGDHEVTVTGALRAGAESELSFTVARGGRDVTTELDPYLGARGHLVVLREGDLAYLHVHPEDDAGLAFATTVPSPGRYAAFLDTSHDGRVRTADFRLEAVR
jgi:hypothetical protein